MNRNATLAALALCLGVLSTSATGTGTDPGQMSLTQARAEVLDFTTIDVPGASATLPRDINPEGDIVGFYGIGTAFRGYLLHQGIVTDFEVPGATATRPRSINPQGDIVGFYVAGGSHSWLPVRRGQLHHH